MIRALEFYHQNGTPISDHNQKQKEQESPYNLAYFVLNLPRELLYERIDRRVDHMMEDGLLEEVAALKKTDAAGEWFPCRGWDIRRSWTIWTDSVLLMKQ